MPSRPQTWSTLPPLDGRVPGRFALAALALVSLLVCLAARAEDTPRLEQQVKAAFLVKFGLFVDWPQGGADQQTNSSFNIGILGQDPFGGYFDAAAKDLHINGKPIKLERGSTIAELADCQVIFISSSEATRIEELVKELAHRPILTVADTPEAARRGVMINFVKEDGKVRFELNAATASRAGLSLSAKLQSVAKVLLPPLAGGGH